ncbi:LON peptidase N-terminal domain and RING finger protein 3-like [Daktulosphaira vitifoliae]|uniref:LON peptidase N-terminal domain and RING finger protein 3-like n=1 Tax=Daktulosphaira vitifoliae TaxID=58002 RepID=UPI0021A993B7|nr:LON peptidase N-terminal domain and RING finger protein 3-like [Daktulosphaira vitifoliae]
MFFSTKIFFTLLFTIFFPMSNANKKKIDTNETDEQNNKLYYHPTIEWDSKDPSKCSSCEKNPYNMTITTCGHRYCYDCEKSMLNGQLNCPLCRDNPIDLSDYPTDFVLPCSMHDLYKLEMYQGYVTRSKLYRKSYHELCDKKQENILK